MSDRTTLQHAWMTGRTAGGSRATAREYDDDHLCQQIKKADVFHSETPSDFERFQPIGMTNVPIKQQEKQGQGQSVSSQQSAGTDQGSGDFNNSQPQGPASEVMMNYMNGSRSHPVAGMVEDRRVRPYGMSEGEGAVYAPDGSEQMLYFKENGTYLVTLDNKSVKDNQNKQTRTLVVGHVEKDMQTHKIDNQQQGQGQQQQQQQKEKYKHEGKSINAGIRISKSRIEFVFNDTVVGFYDGSSKHWKFEGDTITNKANTRNELVGNTYVVGSEGGSAPKQTTTHIKNKYLYSELE
jgi:phage gp45-like